MASQNVWSDFDASRHNVKSNTVERLKQILTGFNEECHANCTKSGKKQDLIDRITREMDAWRANNSVDKWVKGRTILNQVRSTGCYTPQRSAEHSYPAAPSNHAYPVGASHSSFPAVASSSSGAIPRYDPYAPPRRPNVPPPPTSAAAAAPPPGIKFKISPFFRVERAVSAVVECPESTSSMDRRQQSLTFSLTNDIVAKLASASPKYQLRLYCTSSQFYSPSGFRSSKDPCPIEFPPTCEVRVNSIPLNANLKGMKKKPGTAPPPDIMKNVRVQNGATNRVEMVYVNSQQPVQSKKYYLVIMLVEATTVDQLIDRLKKGKYRSSQEVVGKMISAASADDDIIADRQKLSLKCPLSYMRISTPCRSSHCVHSQCFDACSWYSVMEQTTTWLCPVCENVLNVEDLIVDGYFDEILRSTPEEVEDVYVEADGQWHSEDNKYGSARWKATHPEIIPAHSAQAVVPAPKRSPPKPTVNDVNGHGQPSPTSEQIVILDSDDEDEDEGRVKRELSPSNELRASSSKVVPPPIRAQSTADVIDLTLDSDDEEPSPPPTKKRKAMEDPVPSPTEQIWKKSRSEASTPPASVASGSSAWSYPSALPPRPVANGSSPTARYASYASPNHYPGYQAPPPAPSPRRPLPASPYAPRSPEWRR